ncbi:MAG: hypothetical protein KF862_20530 [Chitinophagaceae bacterium]|nr:hypothetical protein [Chitinophagaceae bacterium]
MSSVIKRIAGSAVAKAYLTSIIGIISGLLTQLFFVKELTNKVTTSEFSLYAFVFQVVSYFAILQLGLDFATSREISLSLGKREPQSANYSYWFIRKFNRTIVLLVVIFVLITGFLFFYGIGLTKDYTPLTALLLVLLFGLTQVNTFSIVPEVAALIGSNQQYVANLSNVAVSILSTVLAYVLLTYGAGVYAMPMALIFWGLCNFIFLRRHVKKKCNWIDERPIASNPELEKKTIRYSVATTLGGLAWTIEATSDVIVLNSAGMLHLVGIYVIWWRFPQMLFDLVARFTTSATPGFALAHGRSPRESAQLFLKVFLIACGGGLIVFAGISVWLPSFIKIWIDKVEYQYVDSVHLSRLMGLLVYLRIIGNCLGMYLIAIGKVKITTRLSWVQAIIKIIAAIILVSNFSLTGLFIASIIAASMQVSILGIFLLKEKILSFKLICWLVIATLICSSALYVQTVETDLVYFLLKIFCTAVAIAAIWAFCVWSFGFQNVIGFRLLKK